MIAKELEREGIPVAFITAMSAIGKQVGAARIIRGAKISHPCGDPSSHMEADMALRRKIVECALEALQTDIGEPTIFNPDITYQ